MTDEELYYEIFPNGCWHIWIPSLDRLSEKYAYECMKCQTHNEPHNLNPDFTTPEGFFVMLEGMKMHERWEEFVDWCWSRVDGLVIYGDCDSEWEGLPFKYIHRTRFRDALEKFFEKEEPK